MRICPQGKCLLKIGLGTVAGFLAMNIIRRFKERQKQAKQIDRVPDCIYTCTIPSNSDTVVEPRPTRIDALPVEVWGIIIDHLVTEQLGHRNMQCWILPMILQNRYVCREYASCNACVRSLNDSRNLQERGRSRTASKNLVAPSPSHSCHAYNEAVAGR